MNLSKSLLAIPVASFLVAAAVASGACSSSVSINIPADAVVTYKGSETVPDGITFGTTSCDGDVYFVFSDGYGFCDNGVWDYTTDDPTGFGDYTLDTSVSTGSNTSGSNTSGSNTSGSNTSGSNTSGSSTSGGGSSTSGGGSSTSGGSATTGAQGG